MGIINRAIGWTRQDLSKSIPAMRSGSVNSAGGSSPLPGVVPPDLPATQPLTVDKALGLIPVYRSIEILTTAVSQLELAVYRGGQQIDVPLVIRKPETNDSQFGTLRKTTQSLVTTGNAYWRLLKGKASDEAKGIEVLNPHMIQLIHDTNGDYWAYGNTRLETWAVKHLKLNDVWGSDYGVGPIQRARLDLQGAVDQRDFAAKWFRDAGVPTGVLSSDQELDQDQADAFKARWHQAQADHKVAVLGKGLSYEFTTLSPKDAQFIETQAFSITSVARLFGIPANYLLAEINGNAMTYQNMRDVDTAFVRYTLMTYLKVIEEAFTELVPRGQRVTFQTEGLLRAQDNVRYANHKLALDAGWLTVNEVRALEGFAPLATPNTEEGNDNDDPTQRV